MGTLLFVIGSTDTGAHFAAGKSLQALLPLYLAVSKASNLKAVKNDS